MNELRLGAVEARFADIVWRNAPIATAELVRLCEDELGWKRTTTYTVLKRLSERGLFKNDGGTVFPLMTRDEFYSIQSENVVMNSFGGSLPSFIAAFTSRKSLSEDEIKEIRDIIEKMKRS
ncbi:MAG: BlaI/MecI/CopY family transcriptional regulator [Ruminococcaceae bacterium]|nr:BlaI/MecI/CopY family transcriptional regulator [Oscillospiraceae bacterium]